MTIWLPLEAEQQENHKPEGQMPVKEADNTDPGLVNVNRMPTGISRPIFQAVASALDQQERHDHQSF